MAQKLMKRYFVKNKIDKKTILYWLF